MLEKQIKNELRNFIHSNFMVSEELRGFSDTDSFLHKGIIDSMGIIELLAFVQKQYRIHIEPSEVLPKNFDSLENLELYIRSKTEPTLDALVSESARKWPDGIALLDENESDLTYRKLETWVNIFSNRLIRLGVKRGERVAILSRNSFESVSIYFALLRVGAVVVWLNHSSDAKELGAVSKDAGISLLLHEAEFKAKAEKIASDYGAKAVQPSELKSISDENKNFKSVARAEDLAAIVYTSGSTDKPLGVMLTHRNLLSNNEHIAAYLNLTCEDRVCCVLPFYYIYGLSLLLSHLAVGGSVVLENRFSYPQAALEGMKNQKVTGFSGVSSHFILLMNHTDFLNQELPFLRYFTHAGDKMPVAVTEKILKAFPKKKLFLMYGQTEASPRISYLDPHQTAKKPASAGKALKILNCRF